MSNGHSKTSLEIARHWASLGVPVFPVNSNKEPLTRNGFRDASTDMHQVDTWFKYSKSPGKYVGLVPGHAGFIVLDVDIKNGKLGREEFAKLTSDPTIASVVKTAPQITTPSGGSHYWLKKKEVDDNFGNYALGDDKSIDIRSDNGYVLAPDQLNYEWAYEVDIHSAPTIPDSLQSIILGSGGSSRGQNQSTPYKTLTDLRRKELHPDTLKMLEILERLGGTNPHISEHGEVATVRMTRPGKGAHDGVSIGYKAPDKTMFFTSNWKLPDETFFDTNEAYNLEDLISIEEAGGHLLANGLSGKHSVAKQPKVARKSLKLSEIINRPPPEWLIDGMLIKNGLCAVIGSSGAGKSFVAIDMALCAAFGIPWQGHHVEKTYKVAFIAAESPDSIGVRARAWLKYHEHDGDIDNIVFFDTPFDLTEDRDVNELEIWAKDFQPDMVVIDTLARSMSKDENSNQEMGLLIRNVDRIRRASNSCILLIHHMGWSGGHARGASAFKAAMDVELSVTGEGEFTKVKSSKIKDGRPPKEQVFKRVDVQLDDNHFSCVLVEEEEFCIIEEDEKPITELMMQVLGDNVYSNREWCNEFNEMYPLKKCSESAFTKRRKALEDQLLQDPDNKKWRKK